MYSQFVAAIVIATLCASGSILLIQAPAPATNPTPTTVQTASSGVQPQAPYDLPPLVKTILVIIFSALGAAATVAVMVRSYIRNRVIESLKTTDAQQQMEILLGEERPQRRIVEALNSAAGRQRLGEILTTPQVWPDMAKAVIGTIVPPTMLDRPDIQERLAQVLLTDGCRQAIAAALTTDIAKTNIAAALTTDTAETNIAAALTTDIAKTNIAAALVGHEAEERLNFFLTGVGLATITAVIEGFDLSQRTIDVLNSIAGRDAVMSALEAEQVRLRSITEHNEFRERIVRWLDTEEGQRYVTSLFERNSVRVAVIDAMLSGFILNNEPLEKLKGMLESALAGDDTYMVRLPRAVVDHLIDQRRTQ
jgi:hypothetical protein